MRRPMVTGPGTFAPYRPQASRRGTPGSRAIEVRQRKSNRRKLTAWLKRREERNAR